jgi:hypothetical protein
MLIQPVVRGVRAGDSNSQEHRITIITSPSILPVGTRCQVELNFETNDQGEVTETVYEGKVAKANDDGITLTVTSIKRKAIRQSLASRVPIVNRLVRNVGIARPKPEEAKDVWIPARKIRSVKLDRSRTLRGD